MDPSGNTPLFLFVVFGKLLEVLSEDGLKGVRSPLSIGGDGKRGLEPERKLRMHTSLQRDGRG